MGFWRPSPTSLSPPLLCDSASRITPREAGMASARRTRFAGTYRPSRWMHHRARRMHPAARRTRNPARFLGPAPRRMRHPASRMNPAAPATRNPAGFSIRRFAGCIHQVSGCVTRPPDRSGASPDAEPGRILDPASRRMRHPGRRMHPATRQTRKTAGFSIRRFAVCIHQAVGCVTRPPDGSGASPNAEPGRILDPASRRMRHPDRRMHPATRRI
jgi:hypothetical protein